MLNNHKKEVRTTANAAKFISFYSQHPHDNLNYRKNQTEKGKPFLTSLFLYNRDSLYRSLDFLISCISHQRTSLIHFLTAACFHPLMPFASFDMREPLSSSCNYDPRWIPFLSYQYFWWKHFTGISTASLRLSRRLLFSSHFSMRPLIYRVISCSFDTLTIA